MQQCCYGDTAVVPHGLARSIHADDEVHSAAKPSAVSSAVSVGKHAAWQWRSSSAAEGPDKRLVQVGSATCSAIACSTHTALCSSSGALPEVCSAVLEVCTGLYGVMCAGCATVGHMQFLKSTRRAGCQRRQWLGQRWAKSLQTARRSPTLNAFSFLAHSPELYLLRVLRS